MSEHQRPGHWTGRLLVDFEDLRGFQTDQQFALRKESVLFRSAWVARQAYLPASFDRPIARKWHPREVRPV